ncbi:hypothetical protein SCUCBS95973_005685 [Sporothrix curviconia]|uniref:Carbohydrate-binding module family 18 protein n=1 Tax=Sporothrix curviconia TaxID=1260050 RepID=A0ABP0BZB8_9PEZI
MSLRSSLSAVCLVALAATTAMADSVADAACTRQITAKTGDSCVSVAVANSLTVTQFLQINPTVHSCTLTAGTAYCVSTGPNSPVIAAPPPPVSSSTSTAATPPHVVTSSPHPVTPTPFPPAKPAPSSSSSSSSSSTAAPPAASSSTALIPSPDGSDGICGGQYTCLGSVYGECCSANGYCGNTTDYCGDGCNPLYGQCGLCPAVAPGPASTTVTAFYTTTSILFSTTTALVTVTAPAVTHTVTVSPPAATTRPSPVATPSPTLPGTVGNCTRWHFVRATDTCRRIALTYGTTQAQITAWNPGFDCDDIEDMAGNYICVGVQAGLGGIGGIAPSHQNM